MCFIFLIPGWFSVHFLLDHLLGEMDTQIRLGREPPLFNIVWSRLNNAILKCQAVKKPRNLCAFT
jgi:hypothetical protein